MLRQWRTSKWSMPSSPLVSSNMRSILYRLNATTRSVSVGVASGDTLLKAVADGPLVPPEEAQELLKGARRRAGGVGDRLDTLALQGAELPLDIGVQVAARRASPETAIILVQIPRQGRLDPQNRCGIHSEGLPGTIPRQSHRLAA